MHSAKKLFTVTALVEMAAGLPLLFAPAVVIWILLGVHAPSAEALVVGRIAGAGLFAIGIACWFARADSGSPTIRGLLWAILFYNAAACCVLAFTGFSSLAGVGLWPAAALHGGMLIWCVLSLRGIKPKSESQSRHTSQDARR